MKNRYLICILSLLGLLAGACIDSKGDKPNALLPVGGEADLSMDGFGFDLGGSSDVDSTSFADEDVVVAPENTWCGPQALAYDIEQIPTPPVEDPESLLCDSVFEESTEAVTTTMTYSRENRTLRVENPREVSAVGGRMTFDFVYDEEGRVRTVIREGSDGFYTTGVGRTEYTFDEDGHLIRKLAQRTDFDSEDFVYSQLTTQEWSGDLLLRQVVYAGDSEEASILSETDWTYSDGGYLMSAARERWTEDGVSLGEVEALWEYGNSGPTRVRRYVDGELAMEETWGYSFQGELLERTFDRFSA
ncbi:MAG: hypothetical protein KC561_06205, partial [Myxococcales bacterium]|nr:hypothetical protein [Myxococcales bacterium]